MGPSSFSRHERTCLLEYSCICGSNEFLAETLAASNLHLSWLDG